MNAAAYARLGKDLAERAFITDAWVDGQPRFSAEPHVLPRATYEALAEAAEAVAAVLDEMCGIVAREPRLLEEFFRMTPVQRLLFESSFPLWHAHARADVFLRAGAAPVVCEMNCDTPSGQPEAVSLNQLVRARAGTELLDPCAHLPGALAALIGGMARLLGPREEPAAVGIVYPTEMPDDLALITLLTTALEARGHEVVLGSPYNLHAAPGGGVALFGRPVQVIVRHYKTDWWGEREPLWHDEAPYPDPEPLTAPLRLLLEAQLAGRVAVVNPFGAVLPQNKRCFAFLWERRVLFSPRAQAIIEAHVPPTLRLEAADRGDLERNRADWVLKSDHGCEGEEVLMGALLSDGEWQEALALARPHRFIAQRRFDAVRDAEDRIANHGVFLVAGRAAGVYTRLSRQATDYTARSVPTLVRP